MSCLSEYLEFVASVAAFAAIDGLEEGLTDGLATPAVIAEAIPEITHAIELAQLLQTCYEEAQESDDANSIGNTINSLRQELSSLQSLVSS